MTENQSVNHVHVAPIVNKAAFMLVHIVEVERENRKCLVLLNIGHSGYHNSFIDRTTELQPNKV